VLLGLTAAVFLELVRIPAGEVVIGSTEHDPAAATDEMPQHALFLEEYFAGRYPVTNAQFAAFVDDTQYRTSAELEGDGWTWAGSEWMRVPGAFWRSPLGPGSHVDDKAHHPVALVSWHDASAFCRWSASVTGAAVRLPTEAEWEKAARGPDGRLYPWGSQPPDAERCNSNMRLGDTSAVGQFSPHGDGPYGCADIVGNVWEWTSSLYMPYPYTRAVEGEAAPSPVRRSVRGGSYRSVDRFVRCACRGGDPPNYRIASGGFRVCVSP
jgi:formylglycine-generating enzyme required for sulfatase activity